MPKRAQTDQKEHWGRVYTETEAFFGKGPSQFARQSLEACRQAGVQSLLELGPGQGRDTLFFAEAGLAVTALDYTERSVKEIAAAAQQRGLADLVAAQLHDVVEPLPFPDASFDACYSHMLLCMELTTAQIASALREIHRVLKPGGLAFYSVRSTLDPHYRTGTHLGEDLYEVGPFVIHFLSEERIRALAHGFEMLELARLQEGSLPRDLFTVTLKKRAAVIPLPIIPEAKSMNDPMTSFQAFFSATFGPGALDGKVKHLVALGVSLAVGCDS
ncbi:MAG: methyltransferase domain-containing selenoprotein MduS [Thermodesulfobacteriota bacterium]